MALHQERDELRRRLGIPVYDDKTPWESRHQENPSAEEARAYERLRQVDAEMAAMRAERDRQDALTWEAEKANRHTETVYTTTLPRIIDGYLADARPCPTCATPPEQLRWTHHVQIHSAFGSNFNTSWWVTDCLDCGAEVETIPECAG